MMMNELTEEDTCDICMNLRRVPMTTEELGAIECCDCGEIYMVKINE